MKDGHFSFQTQSPKLKSNSLQEKKWFVFLQFFIIFSTFFLDSLDFHLDSTRIFQVHNMTINFSFVLFFAFFILTICLFRATMHAIDGPPSWSISSHVRIVLKGWPFGPKFFISFLSIKRVMAQECSREMGAFWSTCPKTSIRVISKYHDFRDLCFWSLKGFWQAWSCSKSWCIPNYRLSVPTKIYFFVCLTFEEFDIVSKLRALWPITWAGVIKRFIRYFKIVSFGAPHILFKWFHSERKCLLRWVHYQQ